MLYLASPTKDSCACEDAFRCPKRIINVISSASHSLPHYPGFQTYCWLAANDVQGHFET